MNKNRQCNLRINKEFNLEHYFLGNCHPIIFCPDIYISNFFKYVEILWMLYQNITNQITGLRVCIPRPGVFVSKATEYDFLKDGIKLYRFKIKKSLKLDYL